MSPRQCNSCRGLFLCPVLSNMLRTASHTCYRTKCTINLLSFPYSIRSMIPRQNMRFSELVNIAYKSHKSGRRSACKSSARRSGCSCDNLSSSDNKRALSALYAVKSINSSTYKSFKRSSFRSIYFIFAVLSARFSSPISYCNLIFGICAIRYFSTVLSAIALLLIHLHGL